jgi:acetyl-CoA C-acetyltransferase
MSDTRANELGVTPLARIVATGVSALSPEAVGLEPVEASRQAIGRAGMTIDDTALVELNEAFAAQVLPCAEDLGIDYEKRPRRRDRRRTPLWHDRRLDHDHPPQWPSSA